MPKLSSLATSLASSSLSLPSQVNAAPSLSRTPSRIAPPPPTLFLPSLPHHPPWLEEWTKVGTGVLSGYQLYGVEQRITDRQALLPVIVVFTGEQSDTITTDSYIISGTSIAPGNHLDHAKIEVWNRARSLLKESGARITEIPEGFLPVTGLPNLPPSLTIVLIPSGDYSSVMKLLYMNINIRRLGLGGRSTLRITEIPQIHQIHFQNLFCLPSSLTSTSAQSLSFTDTVLDLIKLVQNALSLFGLGVVSAPGRLRVKDGEEGGYARREHREREENFHLRVADGLLCDQTVYDLNIFGTDIAEPILRYSPPSLESPSNSDLPPSLLAALLSLVMSTRGKLIALGVSDVPRDPFDRRGKFLLACQSFQAQHKLYPITPFLTLPILSTLHMLYTRSRAANPSTTSKVSRAFLNQLDKVDPNSNLPLLHKTNRTEEFETCDLPELVSEFIERGFGGGTVSTLWGVERKEGRRSRKERKAMSGAEEETDLGGGFSTTSEGEGGTVRGVLRGVRERAGRAGRKLGDGLGFTESVVPSKEGSPTLGSTSKLAPSLLISEAPPNTRRPSYDATTDRERDRDTRSSASRLASLLTSAISPDRDTRETDNNSRINLAPPHFSRANTTLGLGRPRSISSRRSVSEQHATRPPSPETYSAMSVPMGAVMSEGAGAHMAPLAGKSRRRRHSINVIQDAPEPFQILSRQRLQMDVNLRMLAYNLKQREHRLAEMVEALQIVNSSYEQAVQSLEMPLKERTAQLDKLEQAALSLTQHTENYSTSESPIAHLTTGSSKIQYSQRALESALAETYTSRGMLISKVGPGGTYDVGTKALSKERGGMRRLVKSLQMWQDWLGFLKKRSMWHLRWKRLQGGEKEAEVHS